MKTSAMKYLSGFAWDYTGPVSIFKGRGYQGVGVSRTMFLTPAMDALDSIPEEMFAVKLSQSANPQLAGKAVFRFFGFRFSPDARFEQVAPDGITITTPLAEIKASTISKLAAVPTAEVSLAIPLKGAWTTLTTADGDFNIYDEKKFPSEDYKKLGEPPYYMKSDVPVTVSLKGAESRGNEYLQSRLSTTLTADEVFVKKAAGKIWGEEDAVESTVDTPAPGAPDSW